MACITVALGLMPFDGASAAAVSSARLRIAEQTGANAVAVAAAKRLPQSILTKESFLNAITVLQAIGRSTNAVVHLMAIVNRHPDVAGSITLETFDEVGRKTPLLVDLKPSGDNYMTDFHHAGGMLALLHTIKPLLHLEARTINGKTLGEELEATPFKPFKYSSELIRPLSNPLYPESALVVLRGNLAPRGAVLKAAASKNRSLLTHTGRALVFKNTADMALRIDDPDLQATKDSVLVLQSVGPIGNPGMPEAGVIPIPRKLGAQGVKDMLRLSDGRMSGTAGGTIVLHISPESAIPDSVFGCVEDGDLIECDIEKRLLRLHVSDEELAHRIAIRSAAKKNEDHTTKKIRGNKRGYRGLAASQRRQLQTSAARPAFKDRFNALLGRKKEDSNSTDVATTKVTGTAERVRHTSEYPGWDQRQRRLPEGWAKTPQEDAGYVVSTEGKDLERVGSAEWVEEQFDDKPKYKGWSKVHKTNALSPEDAGARVIAAAKAVATKASFTESQLQEEGLNLAINDVNAKFKLTKKLRTLVKMNIPDIVMHRATTLKDFQQAIFTKPKPKKLSFALLANDELMANSNLQVRGGRQTAVHKDRNVGRWKLIEKELMNRGLPVFGHGVKADRGFEQA
ncbi:dihydroxy-acid and 6-phosphogluconate dehydratase [Aureobasidium subglaciale]|nr:dihydroxy-acid and 6-phosphogluconate dehydratase [Aureobasidium subglaciale]KAI5217346.1 dihydroxy-acid and 6-phosphogluconate dehydratase [Aureobasidium subglaciale]KAI5220893.1 dihydroxy-acid and 6-phosphogluconate dehydratase [Aureobasidium subglaciale]KAI5258468.1 dihydroxy-acid and 6-phosphogluconate dehydratase [Aureobasidium subglaciale]